MVACKSGGLLKAIVITGAVVFIALALATSTRPRSVEATANPLPPLIACPNLDASPGNTVTVADILTVVQHFGKSYGQSGYEYLWDPISPYNNTSPAGTGSITVADILYVVNHFGNTCPRLDTQIATATRAIADPTFSSILCDPAQATAVNCGGDPQFLTEDATFLAGKNYYPDGTDVPGQGVHYVNMNIGHGTFSAFNAARPEGLVYKGGALVAQLHFVDGSAVGWVASPNIDWLGHLWNWLPNANLIPDSPVANGRFADCFPDTVGFGAYTCPGANGPTDREIAQYKVAHDTDPHVPLTAAQQQLATEKDQQATASQGAGKAASAQYWGHAIGSQYQDQWNDYYCGPAAVSEALAIKPGRFGTVDQGAAAWLLRTDDYGQTSWSAKPAQSAFVPLDYNTGHPVADVLNYEIGTLFYVPHYVPPYTPSSDVGAYLSEVWYYITYMTSDIDAFWPVVANANEIKDGPHLAGHPKNRDIGHWITISGYEDYGYSTRYMDSAHSVWDTVVGWNMGFSSATMVQIMGDRGYVW